MKRASGESGFALLMTLAILVVITVLASTSLVTLRTMIRDSSWQKRLVQAQAIAEAGGQDAMLQLMSTSTWRTGFNQKSFASGYYTVTLSTSVRPVITSVGYAPTLATFGRANRSIKFTTETELIKQYTRAVVTRKSLTMTLPGAIDTYNSEDGTTPSVYGSSAAVWVNTSVIFVATGPVIKGNLTFFNGTSPSTWTVSGTITDSTYTIATLTVNGSSYYTENYNQKGLTPASVYTSGTRNMLVPAGSTATLKSGIYYFNKVDVNGTLLLSFTNGPVIVYFDANLTVNGGGRMVNPSKIPGNAMFYAQTVNVVDINTTEPFYGVLDVQDADVNIDSDFYGAIVCEDLVVSSTGRVHFDRSLERAQVSLVRAVPGTWSTSFAKK